MAGRLALPLLAASLSAAAGVLVLVGVVPPAAPAALPGAPATTAAPPPARPALPVRQDREVLPPAGKVAFGVVTPAGPYDLRQVDDVERAVGSRPDLLLYGQDWRYDAFDAALLASVRDAGLVPMIGWEPWDGRATDPAAHDEGQQPDFALRHISAGRYDDHIRSWARGLRDFGSPVALRFAHEMNGHWYPWAEAANGNRPGDYVRAWRHVHGLFAAEGASNVEWVWSPNVGFPGSRALAGLYPGDAYVDVLGVVGYFGAPSGARGYPTFEELFGPTLRRLKAISSRPVMITETSGTERGGHKAAWTRELFAGLARHPEVVGLIWFDLRKEADWRLTSSPAARDAVRAGLASRRFDTAGPGR